MEDKNETGTDKRRIKSELPGPKRKSPRNLNIAPIFTSANSVGDKVITKSNASVENDEITNGNNGNLSIQRKTVLRDIDNAASNKDYFKAHELNKKLLKLDKKIENANKTKLQERLKTKEDKKSKLAKPQSESKLLKLNEKVQQLSIKRTTILNEIDSAVVEKEFMKAHGLNEKLVKIDKELANVNKNISQTMKVEKPKVKMSKQLKQVKNTKTSIPEVGSASFVESPEMADDPILEVKEKCSKSEWPHCPVFGEDDAVAATNTPTCTAPRVDGGTNLSQHSYMEHMIKKKEESNQLVKLLQSEVLSANNNARLWAEKRISKMGHLTRMDNLEQSPTTNEYMTRCEFAIGINPETKQLVVGFQVEPASTNSPVRSVDHLKHVPSEMKILAKVLGKHLSGLGYETYNTVEERGVWMSAVVTVTRKSEIMLILNVNSSNLSKLAIMNLKIGLKEFFARGEGAKCNIASLYVSEKTENSIEDLSLLSGSYTITETVLGLNHRISPRSFFYANTKDLHKDNTLLDICCGSGSIGLFLASRVGEVIGVDIMEDAVLDARCSANKNNISNVHFVVGAAEDIISNMVKSSIYNDVVAIIDPPSKGLPTKGLQAIRNSPRIKKMSLEPETRKIKVDKIKLFNVQKPRFKKKVPKPQALNRPQAFYRALGDASHDSVTKKTRLTLAHEQVLPTTSRSVVHEDTGIENDLYEDDNLDRSTTSDSVVGGELGNQPNGDISDHHQAVTSDISDMEGEGGNGGVLEKVKKMQSKFCCPKCNCRFKSLVRLQNHNQMIHVPIPCVECNRLISRKKMDRHLDTHDPERESHPCSMCNSVFNRIDNLRAHINKFH